MTKALFETDELVEPVAQALISETDGVMVVSLER